MVPPDCARDRRQRNANREVAVGSDVHGDGRADDTTVNECMSQANRRIPAQSQTDFLHAAQLAAALRSATPALLFGLRLWAAVCLALYIAFWLQLDNAYWAGTSAAIVCQPSLGASLRKGWFRVIGTVVGAVAIVVLTACVPQNRLGFLLGLALWGAGCGLLATLLRNFAAAWPTGRTRR